MTAYETLLRRGRLGRELGARIDLLRALGPRRTRRRLRGDARLGELLAFRAEVHREIWEEAAAEVRAELADLGEGFLELRRGEAKTRVHHERVPLDDPVALDLSENKPLVHRLLADADVPVPEHLEFAAGELDAAAAFVEANAPCVVKPAADTDVGEGVTGGVGTRAGLARAALRAGRASRRLLVERQARGDVYRLLFLDGELLDAVRRRSPTVEGDGRSTIEQLVEAENERRLAARGRAGLWLLKIDLDAVLALEHAGVSLGSVPAVGELVTLKTVTSQGRIEDAETAEVGEALTADARRAVEAVGLRLAGVDLVTPDPSRGLRDAGGVVLEVNCTPGLHHHYLVADRTRATRVAIPVLERLLSP